MKSVIQTGEFPNWFELLFRKLLIANRGEIACRIIRTAQRLEIPVATVYSDADRNALHNTYANQSIYIGASRPSESYLNIERVMEAAIRANADALHPGYGFLSENSALADACEKENIEFVGPSASAIQNMASKSKAAKIAMTAGVPVLPGLRGSGIDDSGLIKKARDIGYPVLLKAAAGGGGRGMSIVHSDAELTEQLQTVRAQAMEFFGDDLVIVEKYLNPARHVEIQVLADKFGNAVHLFDRDCSAQRRYQKIVEEAPAPHINPNTRQQMYEAAISLTEALNYYSVGTVEFLLVDDAFYFLEMNTRLQVEHPVTEQITGIDLVEWQLRIAAGQSITQLTVPQSPLGHSIQSRIYAENPAKAFLPSPGRIDYLHLPDDSAQLQVHTGVRQGDQVDLHYDPLIAKLVVHDETREASINRLQGVLDQTRIVGVDTNVEFLSNLITDDIFQTDMVDVKYVENHLPRLISRATEMPVEILIVALLFVSLQSKGEVQTQNAKSNDLHSPWGSGNGWRLNSRRVFAYSFEFTEKLYHLSVTFVLDKILVNYDNQTYTLEELQFDGGSVTVSIEGEKWHVPVVQVDQTLYLFYRSVRYELILSNHLAKVRASSGIAGSLSAPLPGRIARVLVDVGDRIRAGQTLVVIEAMKMEHQISSPVDGVVTALPFSENQLIDEGASCVSVEAIDTQTNS